MFKASHTINPDVAATLIDDFVGRAMFPLMRAGRLDNNVEFAVSATVLASDLAHEECILLRKAYVLDGARRIRSTSPMRHPRSRSRGAPAYRAAAGRPPSLRRTGETKYAGAVVFEGFVVAVSAFREFYDEGFAGQIAYELWCESVRTIQEEAGNSLGE